MLRDLVTFVRFKKREKHPQKSINFSKVAGFLACNFTKSNIPPWVFFTFFKLNKWYKCITIMMTYFKHWWQHFQPSGRPFFEFYNKFSLEIKVVLHLYKKLRPNFILPYKWLHYIAKLFSLIFRNCLIPGKLTSNWKISNIAPVQK